MILKISEHQSLLFKFNKLSHLLFLLICYGCVENKIPFLQRSQDVFVKLSGIKNKSIKDYSSINIYYNDKTNESFLSYIDKKSKTFKFTSFEKNRIIHEINIKKIIDKFGINSHFISAVINLDSILIMTENDRKIHLINKNGEDINVINLYPSKPFSNSSYEFNYQTLSLSDFPLQYINGNIYTVIAYSDIVLDNTKSIYQYFSRESELIINSDGNIFKKTGKFPLNYCKNFYYDFYPIRCSNNKNQIVYGFKFSDTIYIYEEDKLVDKKLMISKFNTGQTSGMDLSQLMKISYVKKYSYETPKYEKLIFDKYRNLYYRVFRKKQEQINEDGIVKTGIDIEWSLLVFDKDFNKIEEVDLSHQNLSYKWIMPTKEGIYISSFCDKCQEVDLLKFTLFKINLK